MYLGLNAFSHDASAAIVDETGRIIAAVEEERFTRIKQENRFPEESIRYCLKAAGIGASDLKGIGYGWHPLLLIFQRVLWSNLVQYPVPLGLIRKNIRKAANAISITQHFRKVFGTLSPRLKVRYFSHHKAHAASAFFASPFEDAAYLTIDGRGEWETVTWGHAHGTELTQLGATHHPDSIGNLYSGIARFCGFFNPEKDGTTMALAACGEARYAKEFEELFKINIGATSKVFHLNRDFLDCRSGQAQPRQNLERLFGIRKRHPDADLRQEYKDIAASLQATTQEAILELCQKVHNTVKVDRIVLAGGVMLNSVANGLLRERGPFKEIFIQPAANDSGLALGSAYLVAHEGKSKKSAHSMKSASLGPLFSDGEVLEILGNYREIIWEKSADVASEVAKGLAVGKKVAWFQGRMEYGRRALGNRSILADARSLTVKCELNAMKGRESFQPFAISMLSEKSREWLRQGDESPFMLFVDRIRENFAPSVPGAHHIDGSVRVQTVSEKEDPLYHTLIRKFFELTGVPLIINTSFNSQGQPLVCTPTDAVETFLRMHLDVLAIGTFLVTRRTKVLIPDRQYACAQSEADDSVI